MSDVKKLMDINAELESGLATATKPEGFVIRMIDSFQCKDFVNCVAKYVRKNHVQTNETWKRTWKKAKLNL